jgi:kinesin family protein 4/21/27
MAQEAVGVYARLRPDLDSSAPRDDSIIVKKRFDQQRTVQVRNLEFSLDWVWDADAAQEEVYEILGRERVARVMHGYNLCIIAYGQTGTLRATASCLCLGDPTHAPLLCGLSRSDR